MLIINLGPLDGIAWGGLELAAEGGGGVQDVEGACGVDEDEVGVVGYLGVFFYVAQDHLAFAAALLGVEGEEGALEGVKDVAGVHGHNLGRRGED